MTMRLESADSVYVVLSWICGLLSILVEYAAWFAAVLAIAAIILGSMAVAKDKIAYGVIGAILGIYGLLAAFTPISPF